MLEAIAAFIVDVLVELVIVTLLGSAAGAILWMLFFRKRSTLADFLLESDPYRNLAAVTLPIAAVVLLVEYHQPVLASLQSLFT